MIHHLSALPAAMPAAHPLGNKAAKGGAESAILALFGEALAAQLQASDAIPPAAAPAVASQLAAPLLPDALGLASIDASGQAAPDAGEQPEPDQTLAVAAVTDPAQLPGLAPIVPALPVSGQTPSQLPVQSPSQAPQAVPEAAVIAVLPQAMQESALAAALTQAELQPQSTAVPTAELADALPPRGPVPAAAKNPLVLAGMKNLPVTPAGIAANTQHASQNDASQELPPGIQTKAGLGEGFDLQALMPSLERGSGLSTASGVQHLADGARPATAPTAFSALPVQAQGEALGLSLGASRQVAQLVTPFSQPQWQSELGEKVVWLAGRQGQMAALSLNPPSLGNIEVRLNLSGHEAGAQFFSANPTVREAIEAALPRLREMMAEAGLSLGQAMVSSEPFRDREAFAQRAEQGADEAERGGVMALASDVSHGGRPRSGLVDLYV